MEAKKKGSIELYQRFIEEYPDDPLVEEAEEALYELELSKAKGSKDLSEIELFLQKYPDSKSDAGVRELYEELNFERAKKDESIEAIDQFVQKFPDSQYLEQLSFLKATKVNTYEALEEYVKNYPQGESVPVAKERMEILKVEHMEYMKWIFGETVDEKIRQLENFLSKYPNSGYANKALSDISEIRQLDNHIVISAVYDDHRIVNDSFTAKLNQIDRLAIPSQAYLSLWTRLSYTPFKSYKCRVSGIANNNLKQIFNQIPGKYIWINIIISRNEAATTLIIQTPGSNTNWTNKRLTINRWSVEELNNLPLPEFKVIEKFDNSSIDRDFLNVKLESLLENLKASDNLNLTN